MGEAATYMEPPASTMPSRKSPRWPVVIVPVVPPAPFTAIRSSMPSEIQMEPPGPAVIDPSHQLSTNSVEEPFPLAPNVMFKGSCTMVGGLEVVTFNSAPLGVAEDGG